MRISDWSSDVCSSDLHDARIPAQQLLVSEVEFLEHAAAEILDHDIGFLDQAFRHGKAERIAQVDRNRALVAANHAERRAGEIAGFGRTGEDRKSTRLNSSK